jgi:hypothetical protein
MRHIRIITTIVSPTPLLAATFVIHGRIVALLGTSYSRLSPRLCGFSSWITGYSITEDLSDSIIFVTCVCASPIVVSYIDCTAGCCHLGGTRRWWRNCGIEHVGSDSDSFSETSFPPSIHLAYDPWSKGGHIMLGGIAAQLGNQSVLHKSWPTRLIQFTVVILVYVVLKAEFFLRYVRDWPITSSKQSTDTLQMERPEMGLRLKLMTYALEFSTLCLVIRYVEEPASECVACSF